MSRPSDPVLDFIYDRMVYKIVSEVGNAGPWSRLSASRLSKVGYRLVVLRCAQIGIDPPTRSEAEKW